MQVRVVVLRRRLPFVRLCQSARQVLCTAPMNSSSFRWVLSLGSTHKLLLMRSLKHDVQTFARILLKRDGPDSPFHPSTIATSEEVAAFEKSTDGRHCCTPQDFRIDILTGALNRWNRSASIVFAQAFVETGDYDCEDEEKISEAFMTHVRTLRKKFREQGLTAVEVRDRQKQANRDQRKVTVSLNPWHPYR